MCTMSVEIEITSCEDFMKYHFDYYYYYDDDVSI